MTEWDDESNPEVDAGDLALRILELRSAAALEYPEVHVPTCEADGIFADEAGQAGMVVPRPRVTPTASLAGKSTPIQMRVSTMRSAAPDWRIARPRPPFRRPRRSGAV